MKQILKPLGKTMNYGKITTKFLMLMTGATMIFSACSRQPELGKNNEPVEFRLGYFPNVTHAQALIGTNRGDFQKVLGEDMKLTPHTFNAGPSLIEALYAGHIDVAYIGPSPTLNGFQQSEGEEVRLVAGSAVNGVLLIGNKKRNITTIEQLKGGRVATPQIGNTQDISAKYFLANKLGVKLKEQGGDTELFSMANPDIETLFMKDQIDAAWVPEPWGSRIIDSGLATLILEEKELWPEKAFPITNIIARADFLEKHPQVVTRFLQAHVHITSELQHDPQAFADEINAELKRLTSKELPESVIAGALRYTSFDYKIMRDAYQQSFDMAKSLKMIKGDTLDLDKLIVEGPLNKALEAVKDQPATSQSDSATTESATQENAP